MCLFSISIKGQSSTIDSLQQRYQNAANDSLRVTILKNISWQYLNNRGNSELAKRHIDSFYIISKKAGLSWGVSLAQYQYAVLERQKGNYPEALKHINAYLEFDQTKNEPFAIANGLYQKALILDDLGDFNKSLEIYYAILKIYEEKDDPFSIATTLNAMGEIVKKTGKKLDAMEFYNRALSIFRELGNKTEIANCLYNIGDTHLQLEQYDLALQHFKQALELDRETNSDWGMAYDFEAIGKVYGFQKDYENALVYHNQALRLRQKLGLKRELVMSHLEIGTINMEHNQFGKAEKSFKTAIQIAENIGAKSELKDNYEKISELYQQTGKYKEALEYKNKFIGIKDSLFNISRSKQIEELQVRFDTEKKQNAIAALEKDAEITGLRLERQKTLRNITIGAAIILLLFTYFAFNRYKHKQRIKLAEEEKKREVDDAQKRTEIEKQRVAELQKIDQLKDEFLANTSHELRTPLVGIIGLTESLKDGIAGELPKAALENLDMIANSGKRLSHLVNDILDFSKLKNKDLELSIRPVDMHALSTIVLRLSHPLVEDKKLKLINSIPKEVPLVDADENRLQQIMHNLVGNAIKFTQKGYVTVLSGVKDDTLYVSIADTGIGIPSEKIDSIFNSFEQGDGAMQREFGGTGLGLSVTKQLVELHAGTIEVTSEKGKGSIFTFTLPLSATNRKEYEPKGLTMTDFVQSTSSHQIKLTPPGANKLKGNEVPQILIVDDEPINRRVLENHLTLAGYEVTEVSSGKEALKELDGDTLYNMVLLDVMMPEMSGYEVCEKIREKQIASDLPVILLTAKNTVNELVTGFNAGANDYLTKPISKNELLSRIKTHINLNTIHRATSRFVPSEFVKSVGKQSITDVKLGDHIEKNVTVLFSDIRDYTSLAESMTPEQNFKFVNAYVGRMGPIIKENNGFVNQYLGDGIMALFPHKSENALDAAIEMQRTLALYNKRRVKEKGYIPISVGMGLHTGPLIMGIIGDAQRNDPAVIADTVNSASRVEGMTKYFGAKIIISENTMKGIGDTSGFNFRYLGKVKVKGKEKAIGIYECIDGDGVEILSLKLETKPDYDKGVQLFFDQNFDDAQQVFEKILRVNPKDTVVQYFISKVKTYITEGTPKNWQSMMVMHEK